MNINDIGSMSLDDLTKVLDDATAMKDVMLSKLSESDKIKVDDIVKDTNKSSLKDLESRIEELNTKRNA